jgi:hypothetical protein
LLLSKSLYYCFNYFVNLCYVFHLSGSFCNFKYFLLIPKTLWTYNYFLILSITFAYFLLYFITFTTLSYFVLHFNTFIKNLLFSSFHITLVTFSDYLELFVVQFCTIITFYYLLFFSYSFLTLLYSLLHFVSFGYFSLLLVNCGTNL